MLIYFNPIELRMYSIRVIWSDIEVERCKHVFETPTCYRSTQLRYLYSVTLIFLPSVTLTTRIHFSWCCVFGLYHFGCGEYEEFSFAAVPLVAEVTCSVSCGMLTLLRPRPYSLTHSLYVYTLLYSLTVLATLATYYITKQLAPH